MDKSALVQVMAWCCQAPSHCPSQWWPRSMSLKYGVTGPQWVKVYHFFRITILDIMLGTNRNSLWPSEDIWWQRSGSTLAKVIDGVLPDGTKPLPEPMLSHHQWGCMVCTLRYFTRGARELNHISQEVLKNSIHNMNKVIPVYPPFNFVEAGGIIRRAHWDVQHPLAGQGKYKRATLKLFLVILSQYGQMALKVKVNDPYFQYQPRKSPNAYLVQIW